MYASGFSSQPLKNFASRKLLSSQKMAPSLTFNAKKFPSKDEYITHF
jgi:hypothetical protein